jgi:hypothetical protein
LSDEETNGPLIADDPATSARSITGRKIAGGSSPTLCRQPQGGSPGSFLI